MWTTIALVLLIGYFCMSRSFAYVGYPPWHLFVGEVILGAFICFGPRVRDRRWTFAAMRMAPLRRFAKVFLVFFLFGAFQVVHGIRAGYPMLTALRDMAFNYYPLYFFLGLWVSITDRQFMRRLISLAAWVNALYGITFILLLSTVTWVMPGVSKDVVPVPIFGQPMFSAVIVLALLSFDREISNAWLLIVLNTAVLLGMVIRAEWLGFGLGLIVWAWTTKNMKKVVLGGVIVLGLLAVIYVTKFSYTGPESRGGTISATDLLGRVIAPFDADLAANYTSDSQMYEATFLWRAVWWAAIWNSSHEDVSLALIGHGYGFMLGDLVPYLQDSSTRTPHNVFFFALGYTGWIGVMVFAALQYELFRLLWAVKQKTGEPFGIVFWVATVSFSTFTAFFEEPHGGVPFYLMAGIICAPLLYQSDRARGAWRKAEVSRPAGGLGDMGLGVPC